MKLTIKEYLSNSNQNSVHVSLSDVLRILIFALVIYALWPWPWNLALASTVQPFALALVLKVEALALRFGT